MRGDEGGMGEGEGDGEIESALADERDIGGVRSCPVNAMLIGCSDSSLTTSKHSSSSLTPPSSTLSGTSSLLPVSVALISPSP